MSTHPHGLDGSSSVRRGISDVRARLLLGSWLVLFLELALIRWLGSNIVHLSYFTNFVLLGSFLGDRARLPREPRARRSRSRLVAARPARLVVFVHLSSRCEIDRTGDEIIYFTTLEPAGRRRG